MARAAIAAWFVFVAGALQHALGLFLLIALVAGWLVGRRDPR